MGSEPTVYLVCATDYDHHDVIGAFSNRDAAESHCDWLAAQDPRENSHAYMIEEYQVDPPRERLAGAWLVRVDRNGNELRDARMFSDMWTPDDAGAGPLIGNTWEGGYQAWGASPEEALERARAGLATRRPPSEETRTP